jgi:RHS repeat-associated protein
MKKLFLLIPFIILHLYSFSQTDVQRDTRVNAVLKLALASNSGYYIYGRSDSSMFINIAVLNQSSHTMSWFTCHGRLFDSTRLTDAEYGQVTSKKLNPFTLYQHICNEYLTDIAVVKDIFRLNGDNKLVDSLDPNYHALFASESVQKAKTPLQKLIAIENVRKHILTQLAYLNCADPFGLQNTPLFKDNNGLAGAMIQTKDSTVYYNIDPTSAVVKIGLFKNSPEKLYIYNRLSEVIDSVPVLREKYNLLLKEKTDVFLLYRGWLELQWRSAMSNVMRYTRGIDKGDGEFYSQANIKDEKAIEKELYSQLNAIETKISVLISPETKSIEQAVYDTYKNETSEITYVPLLGIGYELIQTRGQKEYELTNHLGNVLATVTDKKLGHSSNDSTVDYYNADVVSAQDYYPFGMLEPGRVLNVEKYRYGFNGKENDNEVKGDGNQQDYGMRIYDPRLGRFLSVDPITKQYPQLTPYQFVSNRPLDGVDQDGLEWSPASLNNGNPRSTTALQKGINPNYYTINPHRQWSPYPITYPGADKGIAPFSSSWSFFSQWGVPKNEIEKEKQRIANEKNWLEAGYNSDGSQPPLMKLQGNKTWNSFADNLALPLLKGYGYVAGVLEFRALLTGAKVLEFPTAASKIDFVRDALNVGKTRNIGLLEGQIGNTKISDIAISGETTRAFSVANPVNRVFTTSEVGGYDRAFDSEVKLLENIAQQYKTTPDIGGSIQLTSERPFCESCSGVVKQFKKMFPNIKVKVVNGAK